MIFSLIHSIRKLKSKIHFFYFGTIYSVSAKHPGKKVRIQKPLLITQEHMEFGDFVVIWKNARIEGLTKYNAATFSPRIILEDYVSIQQNIHLTCANYIRIGKYTAIAANVSITDIDHPYNDITKPIEYQDIRVSSVEIADGCKIYNNAVILPGVKLGKNSVVAANSVVRAGTYPDYCVIAGNPAKIVKQFNQSSGIWEKTFTK